MSRRDSAVPRGVMAITPIFAARAEGAIVEDVDGNHFLDFYAGIGCINMGHCPPQVVKAIQHQAEQFLHTCFMVTPYESYVRLAELLNKQVPGDFPKKTLFVNSGAEAIENAVKIARAYTGRSAIIVFEHGFHGRTLLTMTLTSRTHPFKTGFGPFAPEVYRLPYAYCYRCSYNLQYPSCGLTCAKQLREVLQRQIASESVAAVLFEPVLGEGGFVVPPPEWFAEIATICREHGILTIADEIQTGFGRTGSTFACERFGLVPDLLASAKSIAAGLPLAAVTGRAEVMDAPRPGGLGGTFGGNPVACAAGLAAWDTFVSKDLNNRANRLGSIFAEYTKEWPERYQLIGDVRGTGAMRAIELVRDRITREPAVEEARRVLAECHQRGLLIISSGTYGNVIRLLIPLVATDNQIKEGLGILEQALAKINSGQ
jgi:4-aminobutyrate aminotransferase / (S)-3-amino-2-methylpropionate transaminase / 5-aminovalerate transaminase